SVLERRARKAGLLSRIELRQAKADRLDVEDLAGEVDFAGALHLVHEVPNQNSFFTEIWQTLKPGSKLLVIEPRGHVSQDQFERSVTAAGKLGFRAEAAVRKIGGRSAVLTKPDTR
ncbi:MAG: class I SAM-dependent methyltransferase, partial [Deltaproteobacteria bacterium]